VVGWVCWVKGSSCIRSDWYGSWVGAWEVGWSIIGTAAWGGRLWFCDVVTGNGWKVVGTKYELGGNV
jgi:hypothetical protein